MAILDDDSKRKFDALPQGIPDVVDAAMYLFQVMEKNAETITIKGLEDGISLAMGSGHDRAEMLLTMLLISIRETANRTEE